MRWPGLSALVLACVAGCGAEGSPLGGGTDAAPPDAIQCSIAPTSLPESDRYGREVVYDRVIEADWSHRTWLFVVGDDLLLLTSNAAHRLSADGEVLASAPVDVPGAHGVHLYRVVPGDGHLGAVVAVQGGAYHGTHVCVLAADGVLDIADCSPWAASTLPPLTYDGTGYHAYRSVDGTLQRLTYDLDAVLVATTDLPLADDVTGWLVAAEHGAFGEIVLAFDRVPGATCTRLREHVVEPGGEHRVRELLPADATHRGDPVVHEASAGASSVFDVGCLLSECEADTRSTRLLTTFADDVVALDRVPIPGGHVGPALVLRDGDRTVVFDDIYTCELETPPSCYRCGSHATLSRFGPDGATETFGVEVVSYQPDLGSLVLAGAVLAPGDYVIAYLGGEGVRVTRVLVP